jgi:TldD protein
VKSASQGISAGCGVRVISGERTGYAYTDDLAPEKVLRAARTAALIASGPSREPVVSLNENPNRNLYPINTFSVDADVSAKLALVMRADVAARAYDPRIFQVRASYADELRRILVIGSDGTFATDYQPLARMSVFCIAKQGSVSSRGSAGGGGRVALDYFESEKNPEHFAREAARQAIVQLDAREAPAGEMEVVLGPGWPGILLHEAIGHGLEADFNRKKTSAFAGLIGQRVAGPKCTVVDDGSMPSRRGSINVDDEGASTQKTVLIEDGILKGYLSDKLSSRLMGISNTGNGRRESYEHIPMPRMTNTYMLAGTDSPEDIIRSVKRGIYAANFGGGQVDITNGKFVFSASEAYLIEDGIITSPLRNASLIGNGPDALTKVSMVGHDLQLDEGIGTCGKDGQSVPVGVGIPTIKVDRMTVGGTGA